MLKIIKNAYYRIPNPEFPIPTKQLRIMREIKFDILVLKGINLLKIWFIALQNVKNS
jgi:hypothetical protein